MTCPRCGSDAIRVTVIEPWLTVSGHEEHVGRCECGHRWKLPRNAKNAPPE